MSQTYEDVLIGSAAIKEHNPKLLKRTPKDVDYLSIPRKSREGNIEYIDGSGILDKYDFKNPVASLDEIYTLKVSHSEWEINGSRNEKRSKLQLRTRCPSSSLTAARMRIY